MFLRTEKLSIGYDQYLVQNELNLQIARGEFVCVLGTNGSGKSTLFRTLAGLEKSLAGSTYIDGRDICTIDSVTKSMLFAIVLTEKLDLENTTVFEVVALGRYPYSSWLGGLSEEDKQVVYDSLELVHLRDKADRPFNCLSDGERQRVMIAKALAQDTPLILLDEPTAHLDLPNRVEIMLLLQRLAHETQKAVLLSTHELDLALQAADKIWLMRKHCGGVICGIPEDLVLNGAFQDVFATDAFYFNKANGNFSMNYTCIKPIQVVGEKTQLYWTIRALARLGYRAEASAQVVVEVRKDSWQVGDSEFFTLEELISYLSSLTTL